MGRSPGGDRDARATELEAVGLTRYQAAAYVTLHDLGAARPKQVADAAEIPLARAYEALDDLVLLRLAEPIEGKEKRYRALPIDAALDREIDRVGEGLAALAANGDALAAEFAPREDDTLPSVLMHPGSTRFASTLGHVLRTSGGAEAVLLWSTAKLALGGAPGVGAIPWTRLVVVASPADVADMAPLVAAGLDVRVVPARPWAVERVVADGTLLLRLPSDAATAGVALETRDPGFVADALALVREAHARGVPLRDALRDPAAALAAVQELACDEGRRAALAAEVQTDPPREVALSWGADTSFETWVDALTDWSGEALLVVGPGEAALAAPFIGLFLDPHAPDGRRLRVIASADDAARAELAARGADVRATSAPFVSGGLLVRDRALLWPSPMAAACPVLVSTRDPGVLDHFRVAFERSWNALGDAPPPPKAPVAEAPPRTEG